MSTKVWNWRSSCVNEPLLGPRDWSPKVMVALDDLRVLESRIPKEMILTKEEAEAAPPFLRDAILAGTAFVVKVRDTHEILFVSPRGMVIMTGYMLAVFNGHWGSVEEGLKAKVWHGPS